MGGTVCRRCQGFLVQEWCSELFIEAYYMRCVNCGAIMDPTIERNKRLSTMDRRTAVAAS